MPEAQTVLEERIRERYRLAWIHFRRLLIALERQADAKQGAEPPVGLAYLRDATGLLMEAWNLLEEGPTVPPVSILGIEVRIDTRMPPGVMELRTIREAGADDAELVGAAVRALLCRDCGAFPCHCPAPAGRG